VKKLQQSFFKTGRNAGFLLFGITLLGAVLRFWALDAESYWLDETASAIWASGTIAETIALAKADVHPPLYFILLGFWGDIFGRGDFALRTFSVVLGVLCIPLLFVTARELFKKESVAIIAALLLAVSQFHVQFSQEARGYAMMCFLAICSMYLFLRLLKSPTFTKIFFYFLSGIILLYTHLFGALFIITQNIFLLFFKKNFGLSFKRWAAIQIALFVTFLPWLFIIRDQMAAHKEFWILPFQLSSLPQLLLNFSGSLTVWGIIALAIFCSAIAFALWHKRVFLKSEWEFSFVLLWFAVPIIIAIIASILLQPVFMPRFLIGTLPAFLLLAAYGIHLLKIRFLIISAIAILTICSLINSSILLQETNKERWREAVQFTEDLLQPGDTIIFHAGFTDGTYARYAFKNSIEKLRFPREGNDITPHDLDDLRLLIRDKRRIALVLSHSRDANGDIVKVLKEQFAVKHHRVYAHRSAGSHRELEGVEVYFFEK
jgi:uncharacterized membrane protein